MNSREQSALVRLEEAEKKLANVLRSRDEYRGKLEAARSDLDFKTTAYDGLKADSELFKLEWEKERAEILLGCYSVRSDIMYMAAECHRKKWEFAGEGEYEERAFRALHVIGDQLKRLYDGEPVKRKD